MYKRKLVLSLLVVASLLGGCQTSLHKPVTSYQVIDDVRQMTAQELLAHPEYHRSFLVLDVRQPEELKGPLGALAGVINIPLAELNVRYQELSKEQPVIVICASGGRSMRASCLLIKQGFERVFNLKGGMSAVRQLSGNE